MVRVRLVKKQIELAVITRAVKATIGKDQLRPRSELLAEFNHAVSKYLTQNDRNMLQSITGYPVLDLVADIQNESVITLMKILSSDRWIYSELNVKVAHGLHLLRCVLAERITDARRKGRESSGDVGKKEKELELRKASIP
eukprot:1328201-Amorphochlora_amoeboformis.AAC.1